MSDKAPPHPEATLLGEHQGGWNLGAIFDGWVFMSSDDTLPTTPGTYLTFSPAVCTQAAPFQYIGKGKDLDDRTYQHRKGSVSAGNRPSYEMLFRALDISPPTLEEEKALILPLLKSEKWIIGYIHTETEEDARELEIVLTDIYSPPQNHRVTTPRRADLVGTVYGDFLCLEWKPFSGGVRRTGRSLGEWQWQCQKCGHIREASLARMKRRDAGGRCRSCQPFTVDRAGIRYGELKAVRWIGGSSADGDPQRWLYECDCGRTEVIRNSTMDERTAKGRRVACSACIGRRPPGEEIPPGTEFGRLTVISEAPIQVSELGVPSRRILCICECGGWSTPSVASLHSNNAKSCGGCTQKKAGRQTIPLAGQRAYKRYACICAWCGTEYTAPTSRSLTCSNKCKNKRGYQLELKRTSERNR